MNRGFHGLRLARFYETGVSPLHGAAATGIKGRGSLAAQARGLKLRRAGAPLRAFPYPQNLWTSLWTHDSARLRFRCQIAFLLPWSKNDHIVFCIVIKELR
jgi:hypothetical protein